MRVLFKFRIAAVVAVLSTAIIGCFDGTEIKSNFTDREAPNDVTNLLWKNYNATSTVSSAPASYYGSPVLNATWTPSTSADVSTQSVQLYIGSNCDFATRAPVVVGATDAITRFTSLPDGSYTFRVTTTDKKKNSTVSVCSPVAKVDHSPPVISNVVAPAWINNNNKGAYPITGTCTDSSSGINSNLTIKVYQGTAQKTFSIPCSGGTFNASLDLTSATSGGSFSNAVNAHTIFISATDEAGNYVETYFQRSRDLTAPAIAIANDVWINAANKGSYPVSGTCTDATAGVNGATVTATVTAGAISATGTGNCTSGGFIVNVDTTTVNFPEGINAVTVSASISDQAGNSTTSGSVLRSKDTIPPVIALQSPVPGNLKYKGGTTIPIAFTLTETNALSTQAVQVQYSNGSTTESVSVSIGNGPLTNQDYSSSITTPNISMESFAVSLVYSDPAGNPANLTNFTALLDSDAPTLSSFKVENGASTTLKYMVNISLNASDATSKVSGFCVKLNDSTAPAANDACWIPVGVPYTDAPSAKTIAISNYYRPFPFSGMTPFIARGWVRDELGNTSSVTDANGVDSQAITYISNDPPVITMVSALNASNSSRVVPQGTNVKVQWDVPQEMILASSPISLHYTSDEQTFTPIAGAQTLVDGPNAGCTVDNGFSGCAIVPSPDSGFYRIRVTAKGMRSANTVSYTQGLNDASFSIIAGNPYVGLEGSAKQAVFSPKGRNYLADFTYKQQFVVADDGRIFVNHDQLGILWIDPQTGNLKQLIKKSTTNTANNVSVSAASVRTVFGLALDFQNRLLIYDFDRIRRVDLSTMIISTIIGGGSNSDPSGTVSASSITLSGNQGVMDPFFFSMIPLPNGDLLFSIAQTSLKDFRYSAGAQTVTPMVYTGSGLSDDQNVSWNNPAQVNGPVGFAVAYDPKTSAVTYHVKGFKDTDFIPGYVFVDPTTYASIPIATRSAITFRGGNMTTGMDGNLYWTGSVRKSIRRYDPVANTNSAGLLLGHGSSSYNRDVCVDGSTAAGGTNCAADIDSVFVNKYGRVYFMEKGLIRMIDENNRVVTLYGRYMSNDANLFDSEMGDITHFKLVDRTNFNASNLIVLLDSYTNKFRDIDLAQGIIQPIPGDSFAGFDLTGPFRFELFPGTADIFSSANGGPAGFQRWGLQVYSRGSGWLSLSSPLDTDMPYFDPNADGVDSWNTFMGTENMSILGILNGNILYQRQIFDQNFNATNCMVKQYDVMTLVQSHFIGNNTCDGQYTVGAPMATNSIRPYGMTNVEFEPNLGANGSYLFANEFGNVIYQGNPNGNLEKFADVESGSIYSFTHTYHAQNGINVYYCSNGDLYRLNKNNAGVVSTSLLSFGSTEMRCSRIGGIEYDPTSNALIIPVNSFGKSAIGRYQLP